MFAGKRPICWKAVPAGLVCLLVLSIGVRSYRRIKWENVRPEEVASEFREGGLVDWMSGAFG